MYLCPFKIWGLRCGFALRRYVPQLAIRSALRRFQRLGLALRPLLHIARPNGCPNFLDQLDTIVWKIDKNTSGSALSLLCLSLALL